MTKVKVMDKKPFRKRMLDFNCNHVGFQDPTCLSFICFQKQLNSQQNEVLDEPQICKKVKFIVPA